MNIAVMSFKNEDVSVGVKSLINHYVGADITFLLPVTNKDQTFVQSVLKTCIENQVKVICFISHAAGLEALLQQANDVMIADNPVKEVINTLTIGDALGVVWDDSPTIHHVLHSIEDLALDAWDITDGLERIDYDDEDYESDELHEIMHKSLSTFVDAMSAFVASVVMESLTEAVMERILDAEDKKNISPFDEDDLG